MFICFQSLVVSIQVSDTYVNVSSITVFFSINFGFFGVFLFLKNFCSINYVSIFYSFLKVYLVIVIFINYDS
jgi:hypothetical protein